jgi:NAD(P)-dependent dehydrogenase (short-subunit alcohol dehydrogenase family)
MSRVALVTGAAGGLGQAIAAAFAAEGTALALADLPSRTADLEALAEKLGSAIAVAVDVRERQTLNTAAQAAVDRLGSLDIMVCNAGLNVRKPSLEVTEQDWDTVLDVNLRGVFFSAQAAARQMVAQGRGGKIVSIASIMGLVGGATSSAAYCASQKFGRQAPSSTSRSRPNFLRQFGPGPRPTITFASTHLFGRGPGPGSST